MLVFPKSSIQAGPALLKNDSWRDLDTLDGGALSRLDAIEEAVRTLAPDSDRSVSEIVSRLRICQTAYYTARSLGLFLSLLFGRAIERNGKARFAISDARFPENDPVHVYSSKETIGPALLINAEAFYYSAFRIVELLRKPDCQLPTITPMGVIQVRNNMIQHADPGIGFAFSNDTHTITFNAGAALPNGFIDKGMATNCHEFADDLEGSL